MLMQLTFTLSAALCSLSWCSRLLLLICMAIGVEATGMEEGQRRQLLLTLLRSRAVWSPCVSCLPAPSQPRDPHFSVRSGDEDLLHRGARLPLSSTPRPGLISGPVRAHLTYPHEV